MTSDLEQTAQYAIDLIKSSNVITDFEIALGSSSGVSTGVRLGKVENLEYHLDKSFDVNVYIGKSKGHASSVDLSKQGIVNTIKSAELIAKYTQDDPYSGLAPKELMAFKVPDLDMYHPWDLDPDHSVELARECESSALDEKYITNSDGAEVSSFQGESLYANSNELIAMQKGAKHSLNCSVIAKDGSDMQTAYEYTSALDSRDLEAPDIVGKKVAKLAQDKLGAKEIKSQKCPVIFTPRLSSGLIAELIGALGGSRQFKKTTFLQDSIDKLVLPKQISIEENPLVKKTIGAKAFDRDGVLKRKQYFVQDGRVVSYIMGQYSANQLGLKTTANSGGVNNVVVKHNFDLSFNDMVKNMDTGFIATELMGQGVNGTTGNYSRGALGFWVENGKIQYPVSGLTIAGNLKDMLLGVDSIGNDVDYRTNIKVGSIMIDEMTIAGGS